MKTCLHCGKIFEGKGKMCSDECRRARAKKQRKASQWSRRHGTGMKECKLCGALFEPIGSEYTCMECRYRLHKAEKAEPPKPVKTVTLDDRLKEAKEMGIDPCHYGKYKTLKTLQKSRR